MSAIIYTLPNSTKPAGGVAVMLEHVETLTKYGLRAFAVSAPNFVPWFKTDAIIVRNGPSGWACPAGSILVSPETIDHPFISLFDRRPDVTRVIFCQSYRGIIVPSSPLLRPNEFKFNAVISNSVLVQQCLARETMVLDAPIVPCAINMDRFYRKEKTLSIAYMPNKLMRAKEKIETHLPKNYRDIVWEPILNKTREEAAEILSRSALFLALGFREGFGLPPLEAMASGCLVVGFHAEGAREYASVENGYWHEEGDFAGCASSLCLAIDRFRRNDATYHSMLASGQATVKRYSVDSMERSLIGVMASIINKQDKRLKDFFV